MTDTAAHTLSLAAVQTEWATLPEDVKAQAGDLFVDTIAVLSAGLSQDCYAPLVKALSIELGCASIPGQTEGVPVNTAIQINGGATTVLQLQDGHRMGRGHPASHIVPALLALAEETDAASDAVLSAFVAGYEVGARIGIAMDGLNGFLHDTGTWSTIGTAVAAAHLLSAGDQTCIQAALDSAAATALMPYRDLPVQGASAHHLYIGLGASGGVMAARGALAGMDSLPCTLETFFGPRAGAAFDAAMLSENICGENRWSDFEILNAYFKVHPTCAHLHGANDAITTLLKTHNFSAKDVQSFEIATYAAGLAFDNESPDNALAARFSLSTTVAVAVCCGDLNETTLTDSAVTRDDVRGLAQKIHVVHDPALDAGYPAGRPARVTVTLNDGTQYVESADYPRGDHTNPMSREEKRAKAHRLLSVRFSKANVDTVLQSLDSYCAGGTIGDVTAALRTPAKPNPP